MHTAGLPTFLAASLVLAVTPGPGVLYIVGRTLAQGRQAGLASVAGVACGNGLNAGLAAFGLAALLAVSEAAFLVLRLAGCAWLVWLGIGLLRSGLRARRDLQSGGLPTPVDRPSPGRLWLDGLLVALFNPKTTLFFAAFLPPFIDPSAAALPQALGLGAAFVVVAACSDAVYVLLASAVMARRAAGPPAATGIGRMASGLLLVVLGAIAGMAGMAGMAGAAGSGTAAGPRRLA